MRRVFGEQKSLKILQKRVKKEATSLSFDLFETPAFERLHPVVFTFIKK